MAAPYPPPAVEIHSLNQQQATGSNCGRWVLPCLNFLFYFLNFVPADIGRVSRINDTVFTPPAFAFLIWLAIYIAEGVFVVDQLVSRRLRDSVLIQRQISTLWIFHQILIAAWLIVMERERVLASTIISGILFLLSLLMYLIITYRFRGRGFEQYKVKDFFMVETPFALLLGWESMVCVINTNVLATHLTRDGFFSIEQGTGMQLGTAIGSAGAILTAVVLYSGLPFMMNPALHLPILWGLMWIVWRWTGPEDLALKSGEAGKWATDSLLRGVGYGTFGLLLMTLVFFIIALVLFVKTKLYLLAEVEEDTDDDRGVSPYGSEYEHEGWSPSSGRKRRSPRTAKSALSA